jgi:DNA recombination protein RmuC
MRARLDAQAAAMRQELQALLHAQQQAVTSHMISQVAQLTRLMSEQLGHVRSDLQKGVSSSAEISAQAQQAMREEMRNSQELLARVNNQLGEVQQAGTQLSQASQALQSILGGAKTRGILGEAALEQLLADALPQAGYAMQHRFAGGQTVDAVVRAGEKLVCIDSKFPLEAYRRLTESGEDARREFARAVRAHAESIAEKYILPEQGTLEFAVMFVPSESIYYELLMSADAKGRLDEYCRACRVIPVSPNTLYAYLGAILMGLKGLQVQENARRLMENLSGLERQLETFSDVFAKLGNHLKNAQQTYNDADARLDRARNSLSQMAQGALPEPPTQGALPLLEVVEGKRKASEK